MKKHVHVKNTMANVTNKPFKKNISIMPVNRRTKTVRSIFAKHLIMEIIIGSMALEFLLNSFKIKRA